MLSTLKVLIVRELVDAHHSNTESVVASLAAVFAIIDDVSRTPQWLKRCTQLDHFSLFPTAVGNKLKYYYQEGKRTAVMDGEAELKKLAEAGHQCPRAAIRHTLTATQP